MTHRARVHINILLKLFIGCVLLLAAMPVGAQQPVKWEQVENTASHTPEAEISARSADPVANVTVRDMYVYVELEQPSAVKLFTILGQPVSQAQLPAGISRFRVGARGIYILKVGSSTRRITI